MACTPPHPAFGHPLPAPRGEGDSYEHLCGMCRGRSRQLILRQGEDPAGHIPDGDLAVDVLRRCGLEDRVANARIERAGDQQVDEEPGGRLWSVEAMARGEDLGVEPLAECCV